MTTTRTPRARKPRATPGRPGQVSARTVELRRMLTARRDEVLGRVRHGIDEARADLVGHDDAVLDEGESSAVNIQQDLAFAMIQINAETLRLLDAALARLDAGTYGHCVECRQVIAEPRLRALPFAVRCRDCEHDRERTAHEPSHRFANLR